MQTVPTQLLVIIVKQQLKHQQIRHEHDNFVFIFD